MDINSLLSPSGSPAGDGPTAPDRPNRKTKSGRSAKRTSSGLSHQYVAQNNGKENTRQNHQLPPNAVARAQHESLPSPTGTSLGSAHTVNSALSTPISAPAQPPALAHRQPSTPHMDTLAELAAMQQHQHSARQNSTVLRQLDVLEAQRSPSAFPSPNMQRPPLSTQTSRDLLMADAPTQPAAPREYQTKSLSPSDLETVTQLATYLTENSYDYNSHLKLINLLHSGFTHHLNAMSEGGVQNDPKDYGLLPDMRQAREAMNTRFPVGEQLYKDWIEDEKLLANDFDSRVALLELCKKAISDEPGSACLWCLYVEYIDDLARLANGLAVDGQDAWAEEDQLVGRELGFTFDTVQSVLESGVQAVQWQINNSHIIWDKFLQMILERNDRGTSEYNAFVEARFSERLAMPHATWDETFQSYSQFVSKTDDVHYEEKMVAMNQQCSTAKQQYELRSQREIQLKQVHDSGEKDREWSYYQEYLEFEHQQLAPQSQNGRKKQLSDPPYSSALLHAVFERALARFPTDATLWEDYANTLLQESADPSSHALNVLENGTRHCPWSGNLWSRRLLANEIAGFGIEAIGEIKHKATRSGLVDIGGMEEMLKVYTAWCGTLRRRAFKDGASEDENDTAEMGIRSAIEDVRGMGEQKYGKEYNGDPLYRIERVYIKFLTERGDVEHARQEWRDLIDRQGDFLDFWQRWYVWELLVWGRDQGSKGDGKSLRDPKHVTEMFRLGIHRPNLDWPEKLLELYLNFCEQTESARVLAAAYLEVSAVMKRISQRRNQERLQQAQAEDEEGSDGEVHDSYSATRKRKREGEHVSSERETAAKKNKSTSSQYISPDAPTAPPKRDRENATVQVKGLPSNFPEHKIRRFFHDCGSIKTLQVISTDDGSTAVIEFEEQDDALAAMTRDGKTLGESVVSVQGGSGSTLWVTNFAPDADEKYIRDLFSPFGEVIDIRFPSLQYNTHRRFCYVQYLMSAQATAATSLDGTKLPGNLNLVVKISDPMAKKHRTGATLEGRELYVSNLHWGASEKDLEALIEKYGHVESIRIPRYANGKSKGVGFVVFKDKSEAEAALELDKREFRGRILNVHIGSANAKGAKRQQLTIFPSAASHSLQEVDPAQRENGVSTDAERGRKDHKGDGPNQIERTIVLTGVPDTVNDTRIKALVEPYGALRKIVLRPGDQLAIVEFNNITDAGKAALALDGHELANGRTIGIGSAEDLKKHKNSTHVSEQRPRSMPFGTGLRHRPNPNDRPGGRRGGLGVKRAAASERTTRPTTGPDSKAPARKNEDFRTMYGLGSQKE